VGGGPTGLALAVTLGLRGIGCVLVETRPAAHRIPKGQYLTHRSAEHFYFWGIVDALRAARVMPRGYPIGEITAGVTRHHEVAGSDRHVVEIRLSERHAVSEPRPDRGNRRVEPGRRWRQHRVHYERRRRRVVEQQQRLGEQPVAARQVHHAATAKTAPHAARHLPRLEELLPRQAARLAHGAAERGGERRSFEPSEVVAREAVGGGA